MQNIKEFLQSNQAWTFYWTTFNGIISLAIVFLTGSDYQYIIFILPVLNMITKYLNKKVKEINGG